MQVLYRLDPVGIHDQIHPRLVLVPTVVVAVCVCDLEGGLVFGGMGPFPLIHGINATISHEIMELDLVSFIAVCRHDQISSMEVQVVISIVCEVTIVTGPPRNPFHVPLGCCGGVLSQMELDRVVGICRLNASAERPIHGDVLCRQRMVFIVDFDGVGG